MMLAWILLLTAPARSDPWADEIVDFSPSLDGRGLYNDPRAVLGEPTRTFVDPYSGKTFRASVVVAPFNLDESGRKTLLTLRRGEFVKVRFAEPVEDDLLNPFGIDLLIFGNAFFPADSGIDPETSMDDVTLIGDVFREPVRMAVSPTGIGDPRSHPDHWHVFVDGPFGDGLFPTNAFYWDSCEHAWGNPTDYTFPVDPRWTGDDFINLTAGEAIALYGRSGGGTGFDLAQTPFSWIQYVYLTSDHLGEVDALADVAPHRTLAGDFDFDDDVDLADFARQQRCWTGSDVGSDDCACRMADVDADGDVDEDDYSLLWRDYTGPG